jgi:hypothetical protein
MTVLNDDENNAVPSSKQEYEVEVHEAIQQQDDDEVIIVDDKNQDQNEQDEQEKDKIQKGISFWNHPSLQDISPEKKRAYLYERQGLTDNQIHKVWEEIVNVNESSKSNTRNSNSNSNNTNTDHQHQHQQQQQNMVMQQQRSNVKPMINPTNNLPYGNNNIHPQYQNQNQYQNPQYNNSINNNGYYQQQQQQHQQQQPFNMGMGGGVEDYNNNNNHHHQEGGEYVGEGSSGSSISGEIARGMSLIAVGGFIGLTGAAAIRWLNGGEFDLLPSPKQQHEQQQQQQSEGEKSPIISSSSNINTLDRQQEEDGEEKEKENDGENNAKKLQWNNNDDDDDDSTDEYSDGIDDEEEAYDDDDDDIERCLLERMDTLLNSIDSNSTLQERLIHKLANTSTITDHSMNLLKKSNNNSTEKQQQQQQHKEITTTLNTSLLVSELNEIKDGFTKLLLSRENNNINETTSTNNDDSNDTSNDTNDSTNNNNDDEQQQHNWKEESLELLIKLDKCIQKITTIEEEKKQPSVVDPIIIATVGDGSSTAITTPIAATPSSKTSGQNDIPILLSAPSTPATNSSSSSKQTIDSSTPTATAINTPTTTTKPLLSLKDCIIQIAEKNNDTTIKIGSQLLYLYLTNLSSKPDNQRYRKIYTSNESFQKVENMIGGKDLLQVVGFEFEDCDNNKGILEWIPTKSTEKEIASLILVKEAIAALGVLKSSASLPSLQLIQLALSELSLTPPVPPMMSQQKQQQEYDNNNDDHGNHGDGNGNNNTYNHNQHDAPAAPQTPAGSSLVSPPMPRKKPYDFTSPSPVSGSR